MKLGAIIMAHPDRGQWAYDLLHQLNDQHIHAGICFDQINDVWDTARRSLEMGTHLIGGGTTHWAVIQDDAVLCKDFVAGVKEALRYIPRQSSLSVYLGRVRPFDKQLSTLLDNGTRDDVSFIKMHRVNWGVGLVYPTVQIPKILTYLEKRGTPRNTVRYDLNISNWFLYKKIPVYYTWPSLVGHRGSHSLLNHPDTDRRAFKFLGRDKSALDIDWSKGVASIRMSNNRP